MKALPRKRASLASSSFLSNPPTPAFFEYGDNLTVTPQGHLIVCEDKTGGKVNHLRGVAPSGQIYTLARLNADTELAGACFSPDGQVLFVNAYAPGITLAIRGLLSRFRVQSRLTTAPSAPASSGRTGCGQTSLTHKFSKYPRRNAKSDAGAEHR